MKFGVVIKCIFTAINLLITTGLLLNSTDEFTRPNLKTNIKYASYWRMISFAKVPVRLLHR